MAQSGQGSQYQTMLSMQSDVLKYPTLKKFICITFHNYTCNIVLLLFVLFLLFCCCFNFFVAFSLFVWLPGSHWLEDPDSDVTAKPQHGPTADSSSEEDYFPIYLGYWQIFLTDL